MRIILLAIRTFKKSKYAIVIQPCKEHKYIYKARETETKTERDKHTYSKKGEMREKGYYS